jgi:hypothetical protein
MTKFKSTGKEHGEKREMPHRNNPSLNFLLVSIHSFLGPRLGAAQLMYPSKCVT